VDFSQPYAHVGVYQVQLGGDARNLRWFQDGALDYVYSSHLLEDFEDTRSVLVEWLRVLKRGGVLVLFCPDEQVYREHCKNTGQPYNTQHKIPDLNLEKIKEILSEIGDSRVIYEVPLIDDYSWEIVAKKIL
jgi:predicted SAM-dependent methyltransferase